MPPGQAGRTYAELLRRASLLLARGESVIAGAPFASAGQRAAAAQAAAAASAGLVQLHCTTPPEPATRQASAQPGGAPGTCPHAASQTTVAMAPWPDATVINTGPGDTAKVPDTIIQQALEAIRPHGPEHVWRPAHPYMLPD